MLDLILIILIGVLVNWDIKCIAEKRIDMSYVNKINQIVRNERNFSLVFSPLQS